MLCYVWMKDNLDGAQPLLQADICPEKCITERFLQSESYAVILLNNYYRVHLARQHRFVVDKVALGQFFFSPSTSVFPCQYHSINAPYRYSSTFYSSSWQVGKPYTLQSNARPDTGEHWKELGCHIVFFWTHPLPWLFPLIIMYVLPPDLRKAQYDKYLLIFF